MSSSSASGRGPYTPPFAFYFLTNPPFFDEAARLKQVTQSNQTVTFDRDHNGSAVTPASPTTTATYGYDLLDRTTSQSDTTSSGTTDYNALGQATGSTYSAGGSTTATTYDYVDAGAVYQLGQIAKATATGSGNTQTSTYTYAWYDAPVRSYTDVSGTGAQTNGTSSATFDRARAAGPGQAWPHHRGYGRRDAADRQLRLRSTGQRSPRRAHPGAAISFEHPAGDRRNFSSSTRLVADPLLRRRYGVRPF